MALLVPRRELQLDADHLAELQRPRGGNMAGEGYDPAVRVVICSTHRWWCRARIAGDVQLPLQVWPGAAAGTFVSLTLVRN